MYFGKSIHSISIWRQLLPITYCMRVFRLVDTLNEPFGEIDRIENPLIWHVSFLRPCFTLCSHIANCLGIIFLIITVFFFPLKVSCLVSSTATTITTTCGWPTLLSGGQLLLTLAVDLPYIRLVARLEL